MSTSLNELTQRHINEFAVRSFRDIADGDYIAARMACRAELMDQFLWSSQQAFEKYLKCILLMNRVPAVHVKHDLAEAWRLVESIPGLNVKMRPRGKALFDHVAVYGEYRYRDVPSFIVGHVLLELDIAVWDLRRYCQVLVGPAFTPEDQRMLNEGLAALAASDANPPHKFSLRRGVLENILRTKRHPAREALLWQNALFGARKRRFVRVRDHFQMQNPPLQLYPAMLDEVRKYVFIPSYLAKAWKAQASATASP